MSTDMSKAVEGTGLSPTPGDEAADREKVREIVDPPALPKRLVDAIERRRLARRHPVIPEIAATREAARVLAGDVGEHVWFLARDFLAGWPTTPPDSS